MIKANTKQILYVILFLLVFERLLLFFSLSPLIASDSPSYKVPAMSLLKTGSLGDIGYRTPGYPVFLALIYKFFPYDRAVILIQHLLGFLMILIIISMFDSYTLKIISGTFFLFDVNLLNYEHSILPDLLLTFSALLIFFFLKKYFDTRKAVFVLLLSVMTGISFLTKPILKLYPYIIIVILLLHHVFTKEKFVKFLLTAVVFTLPVSLMWFSWSSINYKKSGYFGLTPSLGVTLAAMTEDFIDLSSSQNSEIKQMYKKYPLSKGNRRSKVLANVMEDLKTKYGYSDSTINEKLMALGIENISNHPFAYLNRAMREAVFFFLTNDSALLAYYPELDASSLARDWAVGKWRNALLKFILNSYVPYFLVLAGFLIFMIMSIFNVAGNYPVIRFPLNVFMLFSVLYVLGVSVFAQFGAARYRLVIQPFMIAAASCAWRSFLSHPAFGKYTQKFFGGV